MGEPTFPPAAIRGGEQAEWERKTRLLNVLTVSGSVVCLLFLVLLYVTSPGSPWIYRLGFWVMLACCVLSWALNNGHVPRPVVAEKLKASLGQLESWEKQVAVKGERADRGPGRGVLLTAKRL